MERHVELTTLDKIVSLCKRRGFIFPSSEIYGGLSSTWDYGPLGVELKRNIREAWWRAIVQARDDVVGLDAAILMHPRTWEASGHADSFTDPLVECKNCNVRHRVDTISATSTCPSCSGELTESRQFNLMFRTFIGPVEDSASQIWLRPETAQGIFVNFQNILNVVRKKIPFGVAQIGKAFRNEITPGNFTFRTREFEQMEMEFFVKPGTDKEWLDFWMEERLNWYIGLGIRADKLRIRAHGPKELAHYAKATYDIEFRFPWDWGELEGIANRGDYDLRTHAEHSRQDLSYFDTESNERYVPYVIEPSGGVDRMALAILVDAYDEEPEAGDRGVRTILHLHPKIAPITIAVLPLSRNERLEPKAREVYDLLRPHYMTQYDDAQSIGRRYRRQDETGTPICVTVDFQTVDEDDAVTIRHRDTMEQIRVPTSGLVEALRIQLASFGS